MAALARVLDVSLALLVLLSNDLSSLGKCGAAAHHTYGAQAVAQIIGELPEGQRRLVLRLARGVLADERRRQPVYARLRREALTTIKAEGGPGLVNVADSEYPTTLPE